ncbi:hypothetical protein HMPREF9406_1102 [Clostridium sp. HGF2]|nr:hypothetical protein HMPREF9406_1102 [Clostridium sp. HGF2]EQJ51061.1 hypothetical protein QSI_4454 [Clostridioides difficile P28]
MKFEDFIIANAFICVSENKFSHTISISFHHNNRIYENWRHIPIFKITASSFLYVFFQ